MNFVVLRKVFLSKWTILLLLIFFKSSLANEFNITVDNAAIIFENIELEEQKQFKIGVKNNSEESREIEIEVHDYIIQDDNIIRISEGAEVDGIKDWIEVENDKFFIGAQENKEISFFINIPENTSLGSHRGGVFFKSGASLQEGVTVDGQIGVHVLVNVAGDVNAGGYIESFKVPLFTAGSIDYITVFKNTGNVHYVPKGVVEIRNVITGYKQLYKYDKHFVFPGKEFTFSHKENIPSQLGLYRVQSIFENGGNQRQVQVAYVVGRFFLLLVGGSLGGIMWFGWWTFRGNKIKDK